MLKMIDVVGVSPAGFSEAVGEKVHFFQVLEQRGAVREGALKEFQAVIRVATEFPEKS